MGSRFSDSGSAIPATTSGQGGSGGSTPAAGEGTKRFPTPVHRVEPTVIDPSEGINYSNDPVRERIQARDLYRMFDTRCKVFLKFSGYKISRRESKTIVKQDVTYCCRLLAYVFKRNNIPIEHIDDN